MKDKQKTLLGIVVVIVIAAALVLFQNPFQSKIATTAAEGTEVGTQLPSFSLETAEGVALDLSSLEGNLIINAWAAWCPFCIAEMPDLQAASDGREDVTVLFVHRTSTEAFSTAQTFLDEFSSPITDPVLLDPEDSFYATFFGFGMPVTLFVSEDGIIRHKKVGPLTPEEIDSLIEEHFSGESSSAGTSNEQIQTTPDGTLFLIDPATFQSGGPPKGGIGVPGGIPAIAEHQVTLETASVASDWLPDDELGLGIVHKGEARFYPFRILVRHEIANDRIQGDPVLITYCPLCFTGIAFFREVKGEEDQFGVSGKLYNSELVMYDQKTSSYWPQTLGKAVVGPLTGTTLQKLPTDTVRWGNWKTVHPETMVLSRDTGFFGSYTGYNPYGQDGNFEDIQLQFPLQNDDNRLSDYTIVYGVEVNGAFKAYPQALAEQQGTITDTLGGQAIEVTWLPSLGSVSVTADGQAIVHETLFWFAWAAFHPDTQLYS